MSKLILFDFECTSCGHQFEELVQPDVHASNCPECGGAGARQISGTHLDPRMGLTKDFPTAAAHWEKKQRQRLKTEKSADEADDRARFNYNRLSL